MGTGWWAQHSLSYIQFGWVASSDLAPGDIVNGSIRVDNVIKFTSGKYSWSSTVLNTLIRCVKDIFC